eukprot:Gb_12030 [translate_table: standard]
MLCVQMDPSNVEINPWNYAIGGILLLLLLVWLAQRKRARLPPGPPCWPIVGNLFQLGQKPNVSLCALAKKYGPLMTLHLGMQTTVVVSSPAMAKEFLCTNDHLLAGRPPKQIAMFHSYHQSSLSWAQYGPRWRMLRKICNTELFSAKRLESLQHLRREQVFRMVRLIYEHHLNGESVNIGHAMFVTSVNLLGNIIFSQNMLNPHSADANEFKETVWKLMELAGKPNLADFFPFLQFLDPQGVRRNAEMYTGRVYGILDKFIHSRLASRSEKSCPPESKDFLDILLDLTGDGDGRGEIAQLNDSDIKALLFDIFLAGSETTASTIEWTMAELIRNPQPMKRVQAELDDVVGRHRRVEESDIEKLPYLQAVVKEVLRLHPPTPLLLPHRAERSCEIGGYLIPKNSQVMVNVWAIGRDPAIWKEPLHFFPERFLEGNHMDYKGHNFELIPFGAGRRICVGLPLAHRMLHFVVASLLHSFDWRLPDGQNSDEMDMTEKFGITLQRAVSLISIPAPRIPSNI